MKSLVKRTWSTIVVVLSVIGGILGILLDAPEFVTTYLPRWMQNSDFWWVTGISVVGLTIITLIWTRRGSETELDFAGERRISQKTLLGKADLRGREFKNKCLFIHDIPRDPGDHITIYDKHFEECDILGPAVIALSSTTFWEDCIYRIPSEHSESLFFPVANDRKVYGVIMTSNCSFRRCTLYGVAFAANRKDIQAIKDVIMWQPGSPFHKPES